MSGGPGSAGAELPPQHKPPHPPPASTQANTNEMSAFKAVGSQLAVTAGKSDLAPEMKTILNYFCRRYQAS